MTALAKYPSRGMSILQEVASVYVALQGVVSIGITGRKSTTKDATDLGGDVYRQKLSDGQADPAVIKVKAFYDPVHATFTNLDPLIDAPPATPTNFKVLHADADQTAEIYGVTGVGVDVSGQVGDFEMADITLETTGARS